MRAPVGMAAGLLLVGLSGYVYLAVTGHSSTPTDAAALSSLYFLVGLVTLGVFVGLEQETSRSVSRAIAERRDLDPVTRTAHRHTRWLLGWTLAALAVAAPVLVSGPLRGQWSLFGALLLAAGSAAAVYVVRGRLGGRQEFVGYSATLATEGLARLLPCVVIFLVAGGTAWAYGVAFAAALGFAALVGRLWLRTAERPGGGEALGRASESGGGEEGRPGSGARRPGTDTDDVGSASATMLGQRVPDDETARQPTTSPPRADTGTGQAAEHLRPEDRAADISEFETPERSAVGGLAYLVLASMLTQVVANLPPLVASTRLRHADVVAAAFGQAFVLVRIPLLLTAPIQAMLLPALTRSAVRQDGPAVRRRVRTGLAAVGALGVAGTAVLAGLGPWALRVFFGTKTDLSHRLLAELGLGTVLLMLTAILQPTLVALDRHRLVPLAWGIGAVVLTGLVLAPVDPLDAAAAGSIGGPLSVVTVMGVGLALALRDAPLAAKPMPPQDPGQPADDPPTSPAPRGTAP